MLSTHCEDGAIPAGNCGTGANCFFGHCTDGDPCDADYQCDSDSCSEGTCLSPPNGEVSVGATCSGSDCVADATCIDSTCVANDGACMGSLYTANVDTSPPDVLNDISNCNLRSVSWVTPDGSYSDHAGSNGSGGPDWVASIVNAVGASA